MGHSPTNAQPLQIVIHGPESSGKTTLCQALATHYQTWIVPEYFRFYWEAKCFAQPEPPWRSEEFLHIGQMQGQLEEHYKRLAHRVLFCDTDVLGTSVWHRRYLNTYSEALEALCRSRRPNLVLLCLPNIPFVQDGVRDGEAVRSSMAEWIHERLTAHKLPFVTMPPSHEARMTLAIEHIDRLIAGSQS